MEFYRGVVIDADEWNDIISNVKSKLGIDFTVYICSRLEIYFEYNYVKKNKNIIKQIEKQIREEIFRCAKELYGFDVTEVHLYKHNKIEFTNRKT